MVTIDVFAIKRLVITGESLFKIRFFAKRVVLVYDVKI